MKLRRWVCFLLCLVLTVCLCTPALADGELFFVAVNDTIPLTLSVFPTYSGGTLYVPYQSSTASRAALRRHTIRPSRPMFCSAAPAR